MMRWLLPVSLVIALAGYFAPWIAHPVAGLVITGLDLGEYVKFLPLVREGAITIWRPGFYAPLVAISAASLLAAYRTDFAYRGWERILLLALAAVAALNLVPPAWTPARLLEPEFRLQTGSLLCLLAALAFSPFLALLPRPFAAAMVTAFVALGCFAPIYGFLRVLPTIQELYNQSLAPAWGMWLMALGLIFIPIAYWLISARLHSSPLKRE